MLVLRVMALQQQGDTRSAHTSLVRALALAAPMGYVSMFLEEGAPMAKLLQAAQTRGIAPDYVETLLAAFPRTEGRGLRTESAEPTYSVLSPQPSALVEPLTTRELEVLRLIADGASNDEIARRLIISLGTVKKHVANIFGKLATQSRTRAVAQARALKLL
jgi:LuxR family maltose regulon positive regulatory protein